MAGSPPNLHTMVSSIARIQGVLKVKVEGHVIRTRLWFHENVRLSWRSLVIVCDNYSCLVRLHHYHWWRLLFLSVLLFFFSFFAPEVYRTNTKPVQVWTPSGPKNTDPVSVTLTYFSTGFPMCGFPLAVNMIWPCISHDCRDIELQRYLGHDLDLLGSRDVICHVTIGFAIWGFI